MFFINSCVWAYNSVEYKNHKSIEKGKWPQSDPFNLSRKVKDFGSVTFSANVILRS